MKNTNDTHLKTIGYILWLFGFTGAHRFYYGKPVSGTIYFFTFGLLFIGWIVDLFLIPSMDRQADLRFRAGRIDYTVAWILLTFLGLFGIHRMYMGKWLSGILYLLTGGLLGLVMGISASSIVSTVTQWTAVVTPPSIALALAAALTVGVVFGVYPALRAASWDPIEALRTE